MAENEKTWLDYFGEMGDVGWGVPGAGEGLEELYEDYAKPWYKSYEGMDYKYPKMAYDLGAFGINTLKDVAQFVPDVATDTLQALKYNAPEWAGGEGLPALSKDQKYILDAWLPFPSVYTEEQGGNPYSDPSIFDKYRNESADRAWNHLLTHEDKGGFMTDEKAEKIWEDVNKDLKWDDWVDENPYREYEEFKDEQWEKFLEVAGRKHRKDILDYIETDVDRSLMEDYGIGADKGALESAFEFGMFGDKKIPFTDQKIGGYAWEGEGLLPYFSPRKDIIRNAHLVSEIVGGPSLLKKVYQGGKKLFPKRPVRDGIMENVKRIEGPGKYDWAEEWLNRRGG